MIQTIAVGTDGSETAGAAVDAAVEIAERFGAKVVLLSAFENGESAYPVEGATLELQWAKNPASLVREILQRTEDEVRRRGLECATLVDEGHPGDVIVRLAAECNADMLVVGNKGMQRRVLGSVPNTVAHKAPCSVYVVKTT
ncbi:MAG TPA: universal stress protein [Thermoleophilaceae bacterium]